MTDFPEYSHRYQSLRMCPTLGYGSKAQIRVDAGLHYLRGNTWPYFYVTADVFIPGRRDIEAGGCMHDEVLKYWPMLKPVIALHLSDDSGIPMHLEANGLYHLGIGPYGTLNLEHAANHFRITVTEAEALRNRLIDTTDRLALLSYGYDKPAYQAFIEQQIPRYHAEAEAAIVLLDELTRKQAERKAAKENDSASV